MSMLTVRADTLGDSPTAADKESSKKEGQYAKDRQAEQGHHDDNNLVQMVRYNEEEHQNRDDPAKPMRLTDIVTACEHITFPPIQSR